MWAKMGRKYDKSLLDFDQQRKGFFVFVSGSRRLCQISSKSDRESADRQTHAHRHTDRDDTGDLIIILSHAMP